MVKFHAAIVLFLFIITIGFSLVFSTTDYLEQCRLSGPHVLTLNGADLICHKCYKCPAGIGMSVNCTGKFVSNTVRIQCVPCIAGVNYSNASDYQQCIACPKMCENEETKGKCLVNKDNRKCIACKKGWYFDNAYQKCLNCSCHNMSKEASGKCSANGFPIEQCKKAFSKPTNPLLKPTNSVSKAVPNQTNRGLTQRAAGWNIIEIFLLIACLILAVIFCGYMYFVGRRLWEFKKRTSRWPHFDEFIRLILPCVPNCICVVVGESGDAIIHADYPIIGCTEFTNCRTDYIPLATNNVQRDATTGTEFPEYRSNYIPPATNNYVQRGQLDHPPISRPTYDRQKSCPVTKVERNIAIKKLTTDFFRQKKCEIDIPQKIPLIVTNTQIECSREGLKVLEINSEVCRQMCIRLNTSNELGTGLKTLAGLMGYSGAKVIELESSHANLAESLIKIWSQPVGNNILKFIGFLKKMGRDDIVELLEYELPDCHCENCVSI